MSEFGSHIKRVLEKVPYIYILGNHDMFRPRDATYHALQAFKDVYPNFTVVDSITHREDLGITFVPFQPDHNTFPTKTLPICIAHQTFVGCDFGGYRPDDGVDPDTISAELIISGHIHMKQAFGKVFYPGSPYSQSMKDIGQVKGLSLLDTDTYKIQFLQSPLLSWHSIEVAVSDVKSTVKSIQDSINQSDNWVVVFTGPRKEIAAVFDSKEWKKLCEKSRISTRTKYVDSNRVERIKIKAHTVTDVVDEYIDRVYSGGIDKTTIKKTMRQLFDNLDKNSV
jgi:DNA repair exonuclease SbcCD nuclease subunit